MGLKVYAQPRRDLFAEELDARLAPSLAEAYLGQGPELYSNPGLFFASTYFSESIRRVLREVAEAVLGRGVRRVFPLFSLYGGGKTHLLLTVMHAVRSPSELARLDPELAQLYSVASPRLVVLDGESDELCPNPLRSLDVKSYRVKTIWGSLAHQLGLYAELREEDERVLAPSTEALRRVLHKQRAIILVDEIAKYATRFMESGDETLRRYGNSVIPFIESLAKAVEESGVALVITLPLEVREGEERYMEAYRAAAKMIRDGIWKMAQGYEIPLRTEEIVEVLKKRIFEAIDDKQVQDLKIRYLSLYSGERKVFGAAALDKASRLDVCAPFHPSFLDTLYDIVTRNPDLQRTRDALRISRYVVRKILEGGEDPDFVMPWHMDLAYDRLRGLLITESSKEFSPVVDKDIMERARRNSLLYKVALSIFLRTYVYGNVLKPERAFPTREDVVFMVYEEGYAKNAGVRPADVLNELEAARGLLLYLQERDGQFWFNPMRSVVELVEDEARRVSLIEATALLEEHVRELVERSTPGAQREGAAPRLFDCSIIGGKELPPDEPGYYLIIVPRRLSRDELRRLIFEREGGSRVYRNSIAVLYPSDERRLERLQGLCSRLKACRTISAQLRELYYDEDARELQKRRLSDFEKRIRSQLEDEILSTFDTIAFPKDYEVIEVKVQSRGSSLARIAEESLASPEVGKAKIDRLDFEELDFILKEVGVDLPEGGSVKLVKDLIDLFSTNSRLPFVKSDLILRALSEGVKRLRIGLQRGDEIYCARVYKTAMELPAAPEGETPPNGVSESDLVLPWRVAAERFLERLSKPLLEETPDGKVRIVHVFRVGDREVPLADLQPNEAAEMLRVYTVLKKVEKLTFPILIDFSPSRMELTPGEEGEVVVELEPVGRITDSVTLNVDSGEIEPMNGQLPLRAVWKLKAPDAEGVYTRKLTVSVPGLERPAVREFSLVVRAKVQPTQLLRGFEVKDLLEFESLTESTRIGPLRLRRGYIRLEQGEQKASLSVENVDPETFKEIFRTLMSGLGIYAPREFTAELELERQAELSEEVKRELSKYKHVVIQ
ncbi:MAG: ATP-binding protein [Thermofilaceae archaeon]|nr:ATP-binding protein [Thermofilaceae archaeon]MCX8179787.1 ATP-binding protein [Thermofilaceae archaeon]MDW8004314.1 DUF499 domain-containing protein [Thermofilaceae archaeon]